MKKIIYLIALLFTFSVVNVKADTINSIDLELYIDEDGHATITEKWDVKASGGTEWFKQLYDIGNSKLSDLSISMDGNPLTYKTWDINESRSEKAGYYGINNTSQGPEICFGKTDLNNHVFTLKYKLSNVIFNVDDAQVFNWTFFPKIYDNNSLGRFSIIIKSYYDFPDTLDVWGYGYKGYAYVENGVIKASNEENSSMEDKYVALQVKFPKETFNTINTNNDFSTFEEVHNAAEEGKFEYDYSDGNTNSNLSTWQKIINFFFFFLWIIPI